jgi:hypothetical protein
MKQLEFEFMKDFEIVDEMKRLNDERIDEEMDKMFETNAKRFNEIMSFYRIPQITRDEIRLLCRWS